MRCQKQVVIGLNFMSGMGFQGPKGVVDREGGTELGVVAHTFNSSTRAAKVSEREFEDSLVYRSFCTDSQATLSQNKTKTTPKNQKQTNSGGEVGGGTRRRLTKAVQSLISNSPPPRSNLVLKSGV